MPRSSLLTRASLLIRLKKATADRSAWDEFVQIYGRHIVRWCRRHGLQEDDAQDVAQDVLMKFWKRLASFEYDPGRSFRSYLSVIVNSAISDHMNKRRRPTFIAGEDLTQLLASLPAREDLVARIEAAYDKELLQVAMQQVEKRVHAHTWRAFYLLALEGRSGVEVAVELGMEVNTAYVARKKVQRMIREVITKLETGGEEATL